MPPITDHHSDKTTKMIVLGNSGTGKTGQLASLAAAGYNIRILDFDNGTDILKDLLTTKDPKFRALYPPECASRVSYIPLTEKMKLINGKAFPVTAQGWSRALRMMENWIDGDLKLGHIETWGPQDILVLDSTTGCGRAAYYHVLGQNAQLMNQPTGYDYQRKIGLAQQLCEELFEMLTAESIKCNIILNAHINYQTEPGQVASNDVEKEHLPQQGFMTILGRALGPRIPRRFNSVVMTRHFGGGIRKLITSTSDKVDLKTSAPTRVKREYPIETGLAELFKALRGEG